MIPCPLARVVTIRLKVRTHRSNARISVGLYANHMHFSTNEALRETHSSTSPSLMGYTRRSITRRIWMKKVALCFMVAVILFSIPALGQLQTAGGDKAPKVGDMAPDFPIARGTTAVADVN